MHTKYRNQTNTSAIFGDENTTIIYHDRILINGDMCCVNMEYTHAYKLGYYSIMRYALTDLYNGYNVYTSYPLSTGIKFLGAKGNYIWVYSYIANKIKKFDIVTSSWTDLSPSFSMINWLGYIGDFIVLLHPYQQKVYVLNVNTDEITHVANLNYPIFAYINNSIAMLAVYDYSTGYDYNIYKMSNNGSSVTVDFVEHLTGLRYIGDTANGMLFTHYFNTQKTVLFEYTFSSNADSIEENEITLLRT